MSSSTILAEYIWIGSTPGQPIMQTLRSKTRVLTANPYLITAKMYETTVLQ